MKQFNLVMIAIVLAVSSSWAAEQGTVQLHSLPPKSCVYVDAARVLPNDGRIVLKPGWHELQVEAKVNGQVMATWRRLNVSAGQTRNLIVALIPVIVPGKVLNPPGPQGPAGPASPPGEGSPFSEALASTLDEIYSYLVGWLGEQIDCLARAAQPVQPLAYWYDPDHQTRLGSSSGPRGPVGAVGTPARWGYRTVCDQGGTRLNAVFLERLNVPTVQKRLDGLQVPNVQPPSRHDLHEWRITIRDKALRAELDQEKRKALSSGVEVGITGPPGPTGPTIDELPADYVSDAMQAELTRRYGEYANWPEGLRRNAVAYRPVRLSPQDVQALLTRLDHDDTLQKRLQDLKVQIDDYAAWVEEKMMRPE